MSQLGNFVWGIADALRGPYKPHQYGDVILSMTILRRLDAILAPSRDQVAKLIAQSPSIEVAAARIKSELASLLHGAVVGGIFARCAGQAASIGGVFVTGLLWGRVQARVAVVWGLMAALVERRWARAVQANASRSLVNPKASCLAHVQVSSKRRLTTRPVRVTRAAVCKIR